MDSLTHIVLGACIGEAIAGKQVGKKALIAGALAQSLPDIDIVASFWLPISHDLLAHRGFTHSLLFIALVSPLLAWLSGIIFRRQGVSFGKWVYFWALQALIHIFIDAFNAYGVEWFYPFSYHRITFNTIYVADPLFTLWPFIVTIALAIMKTGGKYRKPLARIAVVLTFVYLGIGIGFKAYVNGKTKDYLRSNHIAYNDFFTTPTPLNTLLWYTVIKNDSGYYLGYRSVFDHTSTGYRYTSRNDSLLRYAPDKDDLNRLMRFSMGYYTAEMWHDTLIFAIPRFGEINGWAEQNPRFVFHYYLQYPDDNKLVVQRGRFSKWDKHTFDQYISRMMGN